jgi:hypothetical protein
MNFALALKKIFFSRNPNDCLKEMNKYEHQLYKIAAQSNGDRKLWEIVKEGDVEILYEASITDYYNSVLENKQIEHTSWIFNKNGFKNYYYNILYEIYLKDDELFLKALNMYKKDCLLVFLIFESYFYIFNSIKCNRNYLICADKELKIKLDNFRKKLVISHGIKPYINISYIKEILFINELL